MAELAKLSEEQQKVILPNGKRAVYLDRIGRGLTYLKLWGAVGSPRRGQQVISEKVRSLFCNIRKVFRLRLSRRSFVPPVKQILNLTQKIPFKHLKNNANVIADVAESTPEELITESIAQLESVLAHDILERVRVLSLAPSSSWWLMFYWRWATATVKATA